MKLRDYQLQACDSACVSLAEHDSSLIVMPTGTGKTVVFAEIIRRFLQHGRVMVVAHRKELLTQTSAKVRRMCEVAPEIERASLWVNEHNSIFGKPKVVVASVQTMISGMKDRRRMTRFDPNEFVLLVIDECHHSVAASYQEIVDHFRKHSKCKVLGVTATPDRADEKALGRIFSDVAYDYSIVDAIQDGWLVDIEQRYAADVQVDFSNMRTTAGDLNGADLQQELMFERPLQGVARAALEAESQDGLVLVFAAGVEHAERLAEICNRGRQGVANYVTGKTPDDERDAIFMRFRDRKCPILINVGVVTEGVDLPGIDWVVMARPTKSRALYSQMVGRGLRPAYEIADSLNADGMEREARRQLIAESHKPILRVVDLCGNSGRHKLICTADILGGIYDEDVVALAAVEARRRGKPVNMTEELKSAAAEMQRRKELAAKQRANIAARVKTRFVNVDPFDVLRVENRREPAWFRGKLPTEAMVHLLERFGVPESDIEKMSFFKAKQLIDTLIKRAKEKKATFKQSACLRRAGWWDADLSFEEASRRITALKENGWRRPAESRTFA